MDKVLRNRGASGTMTVLAITILLGIVALARAQTASSLHDEFPPTVHRIPDASELALADQTDPSVKWNCCIAGGICYIIGGSCPSGSSPVSCPCYDPQ